MKTTSKKIRKRLNKIWPNLEYVWLWDNTYWLGKHKWMERLLQTSRVPQMQFMNQFNDCDNFALQFLAEVRRKRYLAFEQNTLPEKQRFPVSTGFVFGDMHRGISTLHAWNIFLTDDDKVYMVDATPGENRIWEADPRTDNVLFVFM